MAHTGLCVNGNGQCAHTYFCGLSLSVRARIGGAGRAPARARACGDTKESRRTHHGEEKRRGQRDRGRKEGEARSARRERESPRSDEKVSEPQPRARIPQLKFDSTSSRRGESVLHEWENQRKGGQGPCHQRSVTLKSDLFGQFFF